MENQPESKWNHQPHDPVWYPSREMVVVVWSPDFDIHSGSLGGPHCLHVVTAVVQQSQPSVAGHQEVVGRRREEHQAVDGTGYPRLPHTQTLARLWNKGTVMYVGSQCIIRGLVLR